MTIDDDLRERFDTLRRESVQGLRPPPLSSVRQRARRQQLVRRGLAAGAVVAACAVVFAGGRLLETASVAPRPIGTPTPSAVPVSPVPSPDSQSPGTRAAIAFGPHAVSFVSADRGWALASEGCARCGTLFETRDGGGHWDAVAASVSIPGGKHELSAGQTDMYFADALHGYIFTGWHCSSHCLSITEDGGRTWTPSSLPAVAQLVGGGREVFALTRSQNGRQAALFANTRGSSRWVPIALPAGVQPGSGPPYEQVMVAAEGDALAVLRTGAIQEPRPAGDPGRLWVSADDGRTWSPRPVPCDVATGTDGGAALVSIALGHPSALLVDCFDGKQSSQAQHTEHHLYGSADAGLHWARLADPTHVGYPTLLVDNGAGHAFLATESGGDSMLVGTLDGGVNWHPSIHYASGMFAWADLRFVGPSTGFVLGPTHYSPEHLYRTIDGGRTWQEIRLPSRD